MPLAPERAAFVAWMRDFANVADNYWMRDPKMGEHDAALSAWLYQQREIDRLRAALLTCGRQAVATVTECEACMTPDVCQLRGTCDHYAAEKLRIAKANP